MIDISNIQAFPIPPKIVELQTANTQLKDQNGLLKNILITGGIVIGLLIIVKIYNQKREQNENK